MACYDCTSFYGLSFSDLTDQQVAKIDDANIIKYFTAHDKVTEPRILARLVRILEDSSITELNNLFAKASGNVLEKFGQQPELSALVSKRSDQEVNEKYLSDYDVLINESEQRISLNSILDRVSKMFTVSYYYYRDNNDSVFISLVLASSAVVKFLSRETLQKIRNLIFFSPHQFGSGQAGVEAIKAQVTPAMTPVFYTHLINKLRGELDQYKDKNFDENLTKLIVPYLTQQDLESFILLNKKKYKFLSNIPFITKHQISENSQKSILMSLCRTSAYHRWNDLTIKFNPDLFSCINGTEGSYTVLKSIFVQYSHGRDVLTKPISRDYLNLIFFDKVLPENSNPLLLKLIEQMYQLFETGNKVRNSMAGKPCSSSTS